MEYNFDMYFFVYGLFVFAFGMCIGSFMNVCICRLPESESIVHPRSRCPKCGSGIKYYDNIPVVSYVLLKGKCRKCRTPISFRYPLIEILTGFSAFCVFHRFGLTFEALIYFVFIASLIVVTFIDIDHRIIPNEISLPGIPIGFAAAFAGRLNMPVFSLPDWMNGFFATLHLPVMAGHSILGILAGGGGLAAIALMYYVVKKEEGMGMGDVKLLAMIGAFLGWEGVAFTVFFASSLGTIVGIAIVLYKHKTLKLAVPFGPFLSLGAIAYVFFGTWLTRLYFGM